MQVLDARGLAGDDGSMRPALQVDGLSKSFSAGLFSRPRQVLCGLGFKLEEGQSLGLVGPNGSGKSTLLRTIVGIERPDAGQVRLFGSHPGDPAARAQLGYLPENTPFPAELSARSALELVASLQGWGSKERRQRIDALLGQVGLKEHAQRALGAFSKGMQRRFGLAQTFLHRPRLLLLDEPTAGLDAPGHVVLADLLGEARARGASLIIASHQLADIVEHCDTLIVLVEGRIVASGSPMELFRESGSLRLEIEGLDANALERLESELHKLGGTVTSRGPSSESFLGLYRRLGLGAKE